MWLRKLSIFCHPRSCTLFVTRLFVRSPRVYGDGVGDGWGQCGGYENLIYLFIYKFTPQFSLLRRDKPFRTLIAVGQSPSILGSQTLGRRPVRYALQCQCYNSRFTNNGQKCYKLWPAFKEFAFMCQSRISGGSGQTKRRTSEPSVLCIGFFADR